MKQNLVEYLAFKLLESNVHIAHTHNEDGFSRTERYLRIIILILHRASSNKLLNVSNTVIITYTIVNTTV